MKSKIKKSKKKKVKKPFFKTYIKGRYTLLRLDVATHGRLKRLAKAKGLSQIDFIRIVLEKETK